MAEGILSRVCSVAELLSDANHFLLPYFQRGYAWQEAHVIRLLSDILDATNGRRKLPWYPLGTIIGARSDPTRPEIGLTDGHQRLVTLTILIAILRELETEAALKTRLAACVNRTTPGGGELSPRLVTQSTARDTLATYVQNPGATDDAFPRDIEDLPASDSNIIANREHLKRRLRDMKPAARTVLAGYVLDKCIIVVVEVASEDVARLLFSTMHATGIKPTSGDLFKAQVLGSIDDEQRDTAQDTWEMLEASIGGDKIESLLRQIAIIADRQQPTEPVEDRLDKAFALDKPDQALRFVETRISPVGAHFAEVLSAQLATTDVRSLESRLLRYLSWIRNHDTWLAPTLHWLDRNGSRTPQSLEFLRRIEALAWTQMILGVDAEVRDRRYMALIGQISDGRALDGGGALEIGAAERANLRGILGGANFTKRKYKQFLLLRIDSAMRGENEPLAPPIGTIEHIFPSRPAEKSRWRTDFAGNDAGVLKQMLGNVTLLTTPEQNEVKNKDYVDKRPIYATSAYVLTRRISTHAAWTPAEVRERTRTLVDLIMASWGLG